LEVRIVGAPFLQHRVRYSILQHKLASASETHLRECRIDDKSLDPCALLR